MLPPLITRCESLRIKQRLVCSHLFHVHIVYYPKQSSHSYRRYPSRSSQITRGRALVSQPLLVCSEVTSIHSFLARGDLLQHKSHAYGRQVVLPGEAKKDAWQLSIGCAFWMTNRKTPRGSFELTARFELPIGRRRVEASFLLAACFERPIGSCHVAASNWSCISTA